MDPTLPCPICRCVRAGPLGVFCIGEWGLWTRVIRLFIMSVMMQKSVSLKTSRYQEEGLSGNWLTEWMRQSLSDPNDPPPHILQPLPTPKPTPIPHTVTQHFGTFPGLLGSQADWRGVGPFHVATGCDVFKGIGGSGCSTASINRIRQMIPQKRGVRGSRRNY